MHASTKWLIGVVLLFSTLNTAFAMDKEESGKTIAPTIPFPVLYSIADFHIILFLKNHPTYESIEVFVGENNPDIIRITLTNHDKSQIDYVNNTANKRSDIISNRIQYSANIKSSVYAKEMEFQFDFIDGTPCLIHFSADSEPELKYGGLTDPLGHAPDVFPVMYRQFSTLASNRSFVSFNSTKYFLPVDTAKSVPLFFTAYKGYWTKEFHLALLPSGSFQLPVATLNEKDKIIYTSQHEIYQLKLNEQNEIESIHATPNNQKGKLFISFSPALPPLNKINDQTKYHSRFIMTFDGSNEKIEGSLSLNNSGTNQWICEIKPKEPQWASSKTIFYKIISEENIYRYESQK